MAVTRKHKEEVVATLVEDLDQAGSVILTDFTGIDVALMTDLRVLMRRNGISFTVIKNTLLRRVFDDIKMAEGLEEHGMMEGPTALAYSSDEVIPIKVIRDFADDHNGLPRIKGGFVSGNAYGVAKLMKLADIPSRDELMARLLGSAVSPVQRFVTVSGGVIRKFFNVIIAIRESREHQ